MERIEGEKWFGWKELKERSGVDGKNRIKKSCIDRKKEKE